MSTSSSPAGVVVFGALLVRAGAKEDRPADRRRGHPLSVAEVATKETDLRGAVIAGLDLSGIALTSRHMEGVVATGARLGGAKLNDAMLSGADFVGADLRGADLRGSCLRGADVTGARLNGANFEAADIEQLVGAPTKPPVIGWSSTPRAGACG